MSSSPYTFKSTGTTTRPTRMKPPPEPPLPSPPHSRSRSSSISSTTSFASAVSNHNDDPSNTTDSTPPTLPRFSPAEEASMLATSNILKLAANKQFAARDYSSAISTYDKAIAELPIYLEYELAVLQSNISACHLAMGEWKEAIESAEKGLDCLERELPMEKPKEKAKDKTTNGKDSKNGKPQDKQDNNDDDQIVELPDDTTDEKAAELLQNLNLTDQRKQDITRIRSKLLLRRARSKVMLCDSAPTSSTPTATTTLDTDDPITTQKPRSSPSPFAKDTNTPSSHWSNLSTALSDYTTLSTPTYFSILPTSDRKTVLDMLRTLPPRVEAAKKKEVDEMMGKLKELGNGILKPFGLNTDMFKMTQDPATGGWSMGFDGKSGKG